MATGVLLRAKAGGVRNIGAGKEMNSRQASSLKQVGHPRCACLAENLRHTGGWVSSKARPAYGLDITGGHYGY